MTFVNIHGIYQANDVNPLKNKNKTVERERERESLDEATLSPLAGLVFFSFFFIFCCSSSSSARISPKEISLRKKGLGEWHLANVSSEIRIDMDFS